MLKISNDILDLKSQILLTRTQKWKEIEEGIENVMHSQLMWRMKIVTFSLIEKLICNLFSKGKWFYCVSIKTQ